MALDGMDEARIRDRALEAARWLALMGFRGHPTAPTFGPRISTYHDMVAPDADLPRLLNACRRMLEVVARQIVVEQIAADEIWVRKDRLDDPYGLAWRKTDRGAVLEMVAGLLDEALEAAG